MQAGRGQAGRGPSWLLAPSCGPTCLSRLQVVLGELEGGRRAAVGAWVMPNAPIEPDTPLASFAVPLTALEEVSGEQGVQGGWVGGRPRGRAGGCTGERGCGWWRCAPCEAGTLGSSLQAPHLCAPPALPTGLRFFPGYLSDARREALDETALAVQAQGHAQLLALRPGSQPPLLPAPGGAVAAAAPPLLPGQAGAKGSAGPAPALAVPPTDQRRANGAVHVCEHTECRLPAERFWESSGSGKGGSKGGRELRRTQSSPGP